MKRNYLIIFIIFPTILGCSQSSQTTDQANVDSTNVEETKIGTTFTSSNKEENQTGFSDRKFAVTDLVDNWVRLDYLKSITAQYVNSNKSVKTIISENRGKNSNEFTDIKVSYDKRTSSLEIDDLWSHDSKVATLNTGNEKLDSIKVVYNYDRGSSWLKLINDTLYFDNASFIRRDKLFNTLLTGKYDLYNSVNNFLEELEINEDGSIDNAEYISNVLICDYVKNWNWLEWMTPLNDNADFASVALVRDDTYYNFELVRNANGFDLYHRRSSAFRIMVAEDPNFEEIKGFHFRFEKK